MSKQRIVWKHFEAIYSSDFGLSLFNFQNLLSEHARSIDAKQLKIWQTKIKELYKHVTDIKKIIVKELGKPSLSKDFNIGLVFQIYCYAICTQYSLAKLRKQVIKSRDSPISWKDDAPLYKGGPQDRTLNTFNDIYRKCVSSDNHLFEIRKNLVELGQPVPSEYLKNMNKNICNRKDGTTLKYRLWNMLRFFKSLGKNTDVQLDMCDAGNTQMIQLNPIDLPWAEQVFTHHLRTTGEVTTKPKFTAKSIVIDNSDSPLIYQHSNPDEYFTKRERTQKSLMYILREGSNYNQHRLTHKYNIRPEQRQNITDYLHQLDDEMDTWSKKEQKNAVKGVTEQDIINPLQFIKKTGISKKPLHNPINIVKGDSGNNKYSVWLKHSIPHGSKEIDCYWRICDRAGLTEWDELSDIPNYIGIANLLGKGVVDSGFLFNKYLETWDEVNGK